MNIMIKMEYFHIPSDSHYPQITLPFPSNQYVCISTTNIKCLEDNNPTIRVVKFRIIPLTDDMTCFTLVILR